MNRELINQNLLDLFEKIRMRMDIDMTEDLGIPLLDPFFIEELDLEPIFNELVN